MRVAIIAERIGGQVKETVGIENLISVPRTTGSQLADALRTHIEHYPIEIFEDRKIERAELQGKEKKVFSGGGETFTAPAVIIATGASWRKLNVEGEAEYLGRGVAFCPHCDGPFYQGKHVAVIGGGNSGIEAAIDLAGICRKVTVFEFADTLKADQVLQEKAGSLPNVEIFTSSQTTRVTGDGEKVTGIRIKDRITNEERDYPWTVSSYKSAWQPTAHLSGTHWKRHRPVKSRQTHSAAPRFRVFMQPETCPTYPTNRLS